MTIVRIEVDTKLQQKRKEEEKDSFPKAVYCIYKSEHVVGNRQLSVALEQIQNQALNKKK